MSRLLPYKYEIAVIALSVLALFVHIHLASTLNLGNDEAHYYVWSLKPLFGYLDDAPFVAYIIYFFTHVFGKNELTVRLGAIIFSFLDGIAIYYLSLLLFKDKRASFFAFLFFICSPIFGMILSVMILPDSSLLFFYIVFLIFLYLAINKNNNILLWILTGIFLGLAFISKYTAALIPPSVLLYFLISKKNRNLLTAVYPYLSLLIAIIIFSPVIYWNAVHNFISFKFQLSHGFSVPKPGIIMFVQGWIGQFLVITPFIYIFIVYSFTYSFRYFKFWIKNNHSYSRNYSLERQGGLKNNTGSGRGFDIGNGFKASEKASEGSLFSLVMSAPMLLFFIINGYSHTILLHWPDIGYITAFPLAGFVFSDNARILNEKIKSEGSKIKVLFYRLRFNSLRFYVYFSLFVGAFLSVALYYQIYYNFIPSGKIIRYIDQEQLRHKGGIFDFIPHIPGKPETANVINDLFGWRQSAHYINIIYKCYKRKYPLLFVMTHHYAISDELVYYDNLKPAVNIYNISGFLNQYDLWQNLNKINGRDALFIMDDKYMIYPVKTYAPFFKSVKKIGRLDIYKQLRPVRVFYLYLMKDFKAGSAAKNFTHRLY